MTATKSERTEVSLAHFAAIGDMTEHEYLMRLKALLDDGRFASILQPEACEDLATWAAVREKFVVAFRLSLGRPRDAAMYCEVHRVDRRLEVISAEPGLIGEEPRKAEGGLETFEVSFCDMKSRI